MRTNPFSNFESEEDYREKYCPRYLYVLLLDTSGSMRGDNIAHINEMIHSFQHDILTKCWDNRVLEIAIVSYNSTVQTILEPTCDIEFIDIIIPTLEAKGYGNMKEGILKAIEIVKKRKQFYKTLDVEYKRPCIIMFTDGLEIDVEDAASIVKQDFGKKEYFFQPVVLNEIIDAKDLEVLNSLATNQVIQTSNLKEFSIFRLIQGYLSQPYYGIQLPIDDKTSTSLDEWDDWASC